MTRAIAQIDQDIAALEQLLRQLAEEFATLYQYYLTSLSETARRQLVLASYHLCTQGYPNQFLGLSLSERQTLQQSLQTLARQAQRQMMGQLDSAVQSEEQPASEDDVETAAYDLPNQRDSEQPSSSSSTIPDEELKSAPPRITLDQAITPNDLLDWQETVEEAIAESLQDVSQAANRLLQQSGVLPTKLPEPVLEMATKTGMATETAAPPNLLILVVETETEDEESSITHLMTIRLRLTEIEFSDASLIGARGKIRNLSHRLNQLRQDYHKRQREKAIAEAEAAWRASWYET